MTRRYRAVTIAALVSTALAVTYLLLPPMGTDLSAQVARADFFAEHGFTPVDLRWYAGSQQFGYSLISQPVLALLGVRLTGVIALVSAAMAFAALLLRTNVPRPVLGAVTGAVCIAGNLVSGRVTYALGVAFGVGALLALTVRPAGRTSRLLRYGAAGTAALLASAASPVAGLFVALAGVALLLAGRRTDGLLLALVATAPIAVTAGFFGEGGWMNISPMDTARAVVTSLVVAALVPWRPVRLGALLSAGGVLLSALVHTPVGLNATRLAVMFALPVLAAGARLPALAAGARLPVRTAGARLPARHGKLWLAGLLALVCWWQPPASTIDLREIGDPASDPSYFAPLVEQLHARGVTGRVEVPPTQHYWESAHLGDVPLARGWLRQVDLERNPLFFEELPGGGGTGVPLTPESYRRWLDDNAVAYVALPGAALSWVGLPEAELITSGLPYLTEIWANADWRLFAVADPTPIVAAPASVVAMDAATLTFDAPAAGPVPIRVRYSRWLTVTGGATVAPDGVWTSVRVPGPGRYSLSS